MNRSVIFFHVVKLFRRIVSGVGTFAPLEIRRLFGRPKSRVEDAGPLLIFFFFFLAWLWVGETGREGRRVEKVVEEGPKMKFQFVPMHSTKMAEQPIYEK